MNLSSYVSALRLLSNLAKWHNDYHSMTFADISIGNAPLCRPDARQRVISYLVGVIRSAHR